MQLFFLQVHSKKKSARFNFGLKISLPKWVIHQPHIGQSSFSSQNVAFRHRCWSHDLQQEGVPTSDAEGHSLHLFNPRACCPIQIWSQLLWGNSFCHSCTTFNRRTRPVMHTFVFISEQNVSLYKEHKTICWTRSIMFPKDDSNRIFLPVLWKRLWNGDIWRVRWPHHY